MYSRVFDHLHGDNKQVTVFGFAHISLVDGLICCVQDLEKFISIRFFD